MAGDEEISSEGTTWWQKLQKKLQSDTANFQMEDCTGCRYIGGLGMYGAAAYVAHVGIQRQKLRGARNMLGAAPAILTSGLLISLGTLRLLRINPFSSSGSETGIDIVHRNMKKLQEYSAPKQTGTEEPGR